MSEIFFKLAAVILAVIAAYCLWQGWPETAFIVAVFGCVAFFFSVRVQVKKRNTDRAAESIADIDDLPEVISKQDFYTLLRNLLRDHRSISQNTLLRHLDTLGEKFNKFYDDDLISVDERDSLYEILKENTDFDNLRLMKDIISILFAFRIDKYADYLRTNLNSISSIGVLNEVKNSLQEYETTF